MPINFDNLPESVMLDEVISEFVDYDWCVEMEQWYDEETNEDIYYNIHYTADLKSFLRDTICVNRKTKRCRTLTAKIPERMGRYMLNYDKSQELESETLKHLHTKAVIRHMANGNKLN